MEYQYARFENTVCNFVERWNTYNVLGNVENDNIVLNLLRKMFYILYFRIIMYLALIYIIYNILKYFSN